MQHLLNEAETIRKEFGMVYEVYFDRNEILKGKWYLLRINCFPDREHLYGVVFDIINNNPIRIVDGKLFSSSVLKGEPIKLEKRIESVVRKLNSEVYEIALFENDSKRLLEDYRNQPLAFALNPKIDFIQYPNHPHLNGPYITDNCRFGATLCYTDSPDKLGLIIDGRINEAIFEIILWTFRHQFWKQYFKQFNVSHWIGPQEKVKFNGGAYLKFLNPNGKCHCGSKTTYKNCCRRKDFEEASQSMLPYVSIDEYKKRKDYLEKTYDYDPSKNHEMIENIVYSFFCKYF